MDLSNLLEKEIDFSDFVYILNIKEEKYKTLINKCLSINFVDKKKSENEIQTGYNKLPLDLTSVIPSIGYFQNKVLLM